MSNIFALTCKDLAAIQAAVKRARRRPTPLDVVVKGDSGPLPYLRIADRKPVSRPTPPERIDLPFGYCIAISFEQQPAGLCLHISISAPDTSRLPPDIVIEVLAQACGMSWPPGDNHHGWIEDFYDGPMIGKAVNLVEIVEPMPMPMPTTAVN